MTGATFDSHPPFHNEVARSYFDHSSAPRINTDVVVVEALRREYPQLHLSIVPQQSCNLLSYAAAGHAHVAPIGKDNDRLVWTQYIPSQRRLDGLSDGLGEYVLFGKYIIEYKSREFVVFIANGRDGSSSYPTIVNQYVLSPSATTTKQLLLDAGRWTDSLHDEIWVFDQGRWLKSRELWESIQSSEWSDVILDEDMKENLQKDVNTFFDGRDTYKGLKVPWKRGVIYYGPPGNGKTISIKAMMRALEKRKDPIPTLYVRTLARWLCPGPYQHHRTDD